jgi:hypothetical protein
MAYLSELSLASPIIAERQFMDFLDALLARPPEPSVLLALLEQARVPICFVEEEMARRYHNKSLVLGDDEENCFQQVVLAWQKMSKAYALCARLEAPDTANPQHQAMMALILHRCLYYQGMVIIEHYRARRELPAGVWLDLHAYFQTAEEWGVQESPVEDTLESSLQPTHCSAAYIKLLMIDLASPYSVSVRNFNLIRRWAAMWAPLVSLQQLESERELPPYLIEMTVDAPLHPSAGITQAGKDARRLEASRLNARIAHMLGQLRQRVAPSELGLGEETGEHVIGLLEHLSRPWTQHVPPRKFRRFPAQGEARVTGGFEAMHYFVSGKEFEQPTPSFAYSRRDYDQLFTFRERADTHHDLAIKPLPSFPLEDWSVIDHSASGFRITRAPVGQKITHAQLLAVRPHDGDHYLLSFVTWLMQDAAGALVVGVQNLPGMPVGIGVRRVVEKGPSKELFSRAFLLPAVAAIKAEGSLVLPAGMYQASRDLEIYSGEKTWSVRMKHILQRGMDFDRISYLPL